MEKKRKTRTGTNKRKQVKEDKFLKNTILGLFFLNSFFIVFSFFGNTGFLGNFIKNTFQR